MFDGIEAPGSEIDMMGINNRNSEDHNMGDGSMEIDQTSAKNLPAFHHNALVIATFPWTSGIMMAPTLSNAFDKDHFRYVRYLQKPLPT